MAKRFMDTDLWLEDWFLELDGKEQLFLTYIKARCDHAGVWRPNFKHFEFASKFRINTEQFLAKVNADKERIRVLPNGRWLIIGFIPFQYGTPGKTKRNHALNGALNALAANNVDPKSMGYDLAPSEQLGSCSVAPTDTDTDTEADTDLLASKASDLTNTKQHKRTMDQCAATTCPHLAAVKRVYPKCVAHFKANEEWANQVNKGQDPAALAAAIEAAVQWQVKTLRWIRDNGKFIPDLWRYLQEGQWLSEHTHIWDA